MKPNITFRIYCRQYPGLIGSTTINYMHPWTTCMLSRVANVFLAEHPIIAENYLDAIINHVVYVHQSVHHYSQRYLMEFNRPNCVTPKHYVEYIYNYIRLMGTYGFYVLVVNLMEFELFKELTSKFLPRIVNRISIQ